MDTLNRKPTRNENDIVLIKGVYTPSNGLKFWRTKYFYLCELESLINSIKIMKFGAGFAFIFHNLHWVLLSASIGFKHFSSIENYS